MVKFYLYWQCRDRGSIDGSADPWSLIFHTSHSPVLVTSSHLLIERSGEARARGWPSHLVFVWFWLYDDNYWWQGTTWHPLFCVIPLIFVIVGVRGNTLHHSVQFILPTSGCNVSLPLWVYIIRPSFYAYLTVWNTSGGYPSRTRECSHSRYDPQTDPFHHCECYRPRPGPEILELRNELFQIILKLKMLQQILNTRLLDKLWDLLEMLLAIRLWPQLNLPNGWNNTKLAIFLKGFALAPQFKKPRINRVQLNSKIDYALKSLFPPSRVSSRGLYK